MKPTPAQYAEALQFAINQCNPVEIEKVLDNFVRVLTRNGDIELYPEIESHYRELLAGTQEGYGQGESAENVNAGLLEELNEIAGRVNASAEGEGVVMRVDEKFFEGMQ